MPVEDRIELAATPASAAAARRFVVAALERAGLERLCEDGALCVSELVTNVVLHAGTPLSVVVRIQDSIARIEVHDRSHGDIRGREDLDGTPFAATGRGIHLVAAVADAMGADPSPDGKVAWFELRGAGVAQTASGVPALTTSGPPTGTGCRVHVRDVPVRLVLASEEHIASLIRETQLALASADRGTPTDSGPTGPAALSEGLGRYAPARAAARDVASRARGRGAATVDMEYYVPAAIVEEGAGFLALLDLADELSRRGHLLTLPAPAEVVAFRRWFVTENARQAAGGAPGASFPQSPSRP